MTQHTNYFADFSTVEAMKAHYRDLARANHSDQDGDAETMKIINVQYQEALKACDRQTSDDHAYRYKADIETKLMNKLLELLRLPSLTIAFIGVIEAKLL